MSNKKTLLPQAKIRFWYVQILWQSLYYLHDCRLFLVLLAIQQGRNIQRDGIGKGVSMTARLLIIPLFFSGSVVAMGLLDGQTVSNPSMPRALWSVAGAALATKVANVLKDKIDVAEQQEGLSQSRMLRLGYDLARIIALVGYVSTMYHLVEWVKNDGDWNIHSRRWEKRLVLMNTVLGKDSAEREPDAIIETLNKDFAGRAVIERLACIGGRIDKDGKVMSFIDPRSRCNDARKKELATRGLKYIKKSIGF
jgi:hypothetical protein